MKVRFANRTSGEPRGERSAPVTAVRFAVRSACTLSIVLAAAVALVPAASASQFIDRNATDVRFSLDAQGDALITYVAEEETKHVILNGSAINAIPPAQGKTQVRFHVQYLNPAFPRFWASFTVACRPYDGPKLPYLVAACKAPDGSYWAAQSWPTPLPDLGFTPWTDTQRELWLDVSHWSGPVAQLVAYPDWVYSGHFHSLFGRFTYDGTPVYGFGTTRYGAPTDGFGRLIYLDTFDSPYGSGWRRENSFVPHNPTGVFCYGFYPFDPTKGGYQHPQGQTEIRGPGIGSSYRLIGVGPGVTPDVEATVADPGDFNANSDTSVAVRLKEWQLLSTFIGQDKQCRQGRALGAVNVTVEKTWFSSSPGGASTTSFTLTNPAYLNVQFAQAPPSSNGILASASVTWVHHDYSTTRVTTTAVSVSPDGLVASAPFPLNQNNRRFAGSWTATLVLDGLMMAQGTIDAALVPGTPYNITRPVVTGAPTVGSTLTVSSGAWSFTPTRYDFYWFRCPAQGGQCVNLSTASTYTVTSADVGWDLQVDVTAWSPSGSPAGSGVDVGTVSAG